MPAEKVDEKQQGRQRRRLSNSAATDAAQEATTAKGLVSSKGRPTPSRRREEEEEQSGNFLTRTANGFVEYLKGVRSELGKVTWPTRAEARRLTIIVVIALILAAITLGLISAGFTELFRQGLTQPAILLVFMAVAIGAGLLIWRTNSKRSSSY